MPKQPDPISQTIPRAALSAIFGALPMMLPPEALAAATPALERVKTGRRVAVLIDGQLAIELIITDE